MKLFCFGTFLCLPLFFATAQDSKKDSITQLKEVIVLDAVKTKQVSGITTSSIIGKGVFKNYSPIDAVSALNQVSGVYVLSGAINTNRITVRGVGARTLFGTDKLRMYYNDIPITNGTGTSEIEAYDLENLNSIEVIKGPKATAFASNLGGAILIKPKQELQKNTTFLNNFTLGSYGLIKNNFRFLHTDQNVALNFSYGHTETNGYRNNSSYLRNGYLLNTTFITSQKNKLSLLVNHIDYRAEIPSSLNKSNFDENPKQAAFTWGSAKGYEDNKSTLVGVSNTHQFSGKLQNTTTIFYSYLDHYEPRPFNILDEFTHGFGFRTRFEGNFYIGDKETKYVLGTELHKDEYNWKTFDNQYQSNNGMGSLQGDELSDNKEYRTQLNTFAVATMAFSDVFSAQLGLNLNKTKYNFQDFFNLGAENKNAQRNFDAILLPSVNLRYQSSKRVSFFGNVSRGFSNPNLEETLTPGGVINPEIAQETGTNYELGTSLFLDSKKLKIDVALYQMNIKNLLVAERTGNDEFIGKNAGKTRHKGLELNVNYTISFSNAMQFIPFVSYTYNHHKFKDFVDEDVDYSGNWVTGVPKNRITSGMQFRAKNGLYWNVLHQFVDKIPMTDANSLYSDAFNVFNFKIGYEKQLESNFRLALNFGINNILDTAYAQSVLINASSFGGNAPRYYYPANDRNFYGGLQLRYQL